LGYPPQTRRVAFGDPVVGHVRYKATQKLGLKQVPVHVARDLSPPQVRAYRLADNKTAEAATWDPELLPLELKDLQGETVVCPKCGHEFAVD
jgi:ParB-like chromosome segregation protein Spo0J